MLQSKCNCHLYHLIYVLTENDIPFFKEKHKCQGYSFEGLELEVQHKQDANIPFDVIHEVTKGELYLIHSQSTENTYTVNVEGHTCNCVEFPCISYCNHFRAIQIHFLKVVNEILLSSTFASDKPSSFSNGKDNLSEVKTEANNNSVSSPTAVLAAISSKIQCLAVCIILQPPTQLTNPIAGQHS